MVEKKTISELIKYGVEVLKNNQIESSLLDAQLIMGMAINKDKLFIITNPQYEVSSLQVSEYVKKINDRVKGMPTQYILGKQEFMGVDFEVNKDVLIPRPDTEILVEEVIRSASKGKKYKIIDIGTGSGCISVSLAKYIPCCKLYAVDISERALEIAKRNAQKNGVSEKIYFIKGDILKGFPKIDIKFDIIVSNPPYIPTKAVNGLDANVKDYEPYGALDGGEDGLKFYKSIIRQASLYLEQGGQIFFEIGYDQAEQVKQLLESSHFDDICVVKDLAGLDRVIKARYNK